MFDHCTDVAPKPLGVCGCGLCVPLDSISASILPSTNREARPSRLDNRNKAASALIAKFGEGK